MFVPALHPTGDVGVICVPGSLSVLLLLPPSCRRLLCTANWDNRPGPAGSQPPWVGPGDGGSCLLPKLRENPSVQLQLPGLRARIGWSTTKRGVHGAEKKQGEAKKKLDQLSVSISIPILRLVRLGKWLQRARQHNITYYYYIVFGHHCSHNFVTDLTAHGGTAKDHMTYTSARLRK